MENPRWTSKMMRGQLPLCSDPTWGGARVTVVGSFRIQTPCFGLLPHSPENKVNSDRNYKAYLKSKDASKRTLCFSPGMYTLQGPKGTGTHHGPDKIKGLNPNIQMPYIRFCLLFPPVLSPFITQFPSEYILWEPRYSK